MISQASGWLRQWLINPLAGRLSAGGRDHSDQPAFSISDALKAPGQILIVPDDRPGGLFLGAPQFWAIRHRYPDATISILVEAQKGYIAREIPFVDEVIVYENFLLPVGNRIRDVVRSLRQRNFDIAFCFSGEESLCPASLCYKSGARLRVGFQRDDFPFFNIRIVPRPRACYEPERFALIPRTLGIPQVKERVSWSVSREGARRIRERYLVGRSAGERFLGLDISSTPHRPTLKQFQHIAEGAVSLPDTRLLVFFDFAVRKDANRLKEALGQKVLLFQTDDLPKIVALLEACHRLIAGNTDLFHLAVAMALPTTGIFASGEAARWVPADRENVETLQYEALQSWPPQQVQAEIRKRLAVEPDRKEVSLQDQGSVL